MSSNAIYRIKENLIGVYEKEGIYKLDKHNDKNFIFNHHPEYKTSQDDYLLKTYFNSDKLSLNEKLNELIYELTHNKQFLSNNVSSLESTIDYGVISNEETQKKTF